MLFSTRIIVRFGDVDSAGFVYYPRIFHYLHIALEEFFAARCGTAYHHLMSEERTGFPTVNAQTQFFAPLVYGDEIDVSMRVIKVGETSVTFEYDIRRAGDEKLCVRSTQVHAAMNLDTRRAMPISEKYRRLLLEA